MWVCPASYPLTTLRGSTMPDASPHSVLVFTQGDLRSRCPGHNLIFFPWGGLGWRLCYAVGRGRCSSWAPWLPSQLRRAKASAASVLPAPWPPSSTAPRPSPMRWKGEGMHAQRAVGEVQ